MKRHGYDTDLTDQEWALLEPLLPPPTGKGRPRRWPRRIIVNAILYLLRTGCAWRMLPVDFPPWSTVHSHYRRWRLIGVWPHVHDQLRDMLHERMGRSAQPSAGILDSQSVKTSEAGGPRGFDGAKKVNGRKRHVLVDTTGLILNVVVHPADVQDREGGKLVLDGITQKLPKLEKVWADQGYTGGFQRWVHTTVGIVLEVVDPWWRQIKRYNPELLGSLGLDATFNVVPRRWVVERTFGWLVKNRRLVRDDEALPETTEMLVYLAMIRIMLARLVRP